MQLTSSLSSPRARASSTCLHCTGMCSAGRYPVWCLIGCLKQNPRSTSANSVLCCLFSLAWLLSTHSANSSNGFPWARAVKSSATAPRSLAAPGCGARTEKKILMQQVIPWPWLAGPMTYLASWLAPALIDQRAAMPRAAPQLLSHRYLRFRFRQSPFRGEPQS